MSLQSASLSPVSSSSRPVEASPKRKQTTIEECYKRARAQELKVSLRDRPSLEETMRELSLIDSKQ